uniref:Uncharacterized protein n=1 Tax=Gasterosteus aculeatus TaxID=69293 RepID=G3N9Y9_GASAC
MFLDGPGGGTNLSTAHAALSDRLKTYFYAGFSQDIQSCELVGLVKEVEVEDEEEEEEEEEEEGGDPPVELNLHLLLLNLLRLIFTKSLFFSGLLTIRAVLS